MKTLRLATIAFILPAVWCHATVARAQTSVTLSGSPSLRIQSAVAGSNPTPVSNSVASYNIGGRDRSSTYKLTARLSSNMPTGTTLTVLAAVDVGDTSMGAVTLDTTTRDIVTTINSPTASAKTLTYTLTASAAAGVVTSQTRTVTYTVTLAP